MARIITTPHHQQLGPFITAGVFNAVEVHAARIIVDKVFDLAGQDPVFLDYLAVAVAVWAPSHGHVCADLGAIAARVADEHRGREVDDSVNLGSLPWPDPTTWTSHLRAGPLVDIARPLDPSNPGHDLTKPLVLDGENLYLTRQYIDEFDVAENLWARFAAGADADLTAASARVVSELGPALSQEQLSAVANALTHDTSVLMGGPGTGKTHTIAAILHMLHKDHAENDDTSGPLSVALVAPTAKASRQMASSIDESLKSGGFPGTFAAELSAAGKKASTIHRLLGTNLDNRGRFTHNRRHRLPHKVVIVDEVSMVSLSLMARLLEAMAPGTKLILVGDGEQLKSVENGAVLPEIAKLRESSHPFPITTLTVNRRQMDPQTGVINEIGALAALMREVGDSGAREVIDLLRQGGDRVTWLELAAHTPDPLADGGILELLDGDLGAFKEAKAAAEQGDADSALTALGRVRVLCGHRKGGYGVSGWNKAIADALDIPMELTAAGLPLLNTKNDLRTGLVNGDNGIVVTNAGSTTAVFRATNDSGQSVIRRFEPASLEHTEVSFATTVHKAQGSQYQTTIVVCPPEESPLATRELIYTAVTRASERLVVIADQRSLEKAITTRVVRDSALSRRIIQFIEHR